MRQGFPIAPNLIMRLGHANARKRLRLGIPAHLGAQRTPQHRRGILAVRIVQSDEWVLASGDGTMVH